jgi:hypothetical protein
MSTFSPPPPLRPPSHTHSGPIGLQGLSIQIAEDPFLSSFRQFAALNARNLLFLQSELATFERKLLELDARLQATNDVANHGTRQGEYGTTRKDEKRVEDTSGAEEDRQARTSENGNGNGNKDQSNEIRELNLQIRDALDTYSTFLISPPNTPSDAVTHVPRQSPSPPSFPTGLTETNCDNSSGFTRAVIMGAIGEVDRSCGY